MFQFVKYRKYNIINKYIKNQTVNDQKSLKSSFVFTSFITRIFQLIFVVRE